VPLGFGFDYVDVDNVGTQVRVGASVFGVARTGDADSGVTPDDFAFFGVVGVSPADIPGGAFQLITGEGMLIDNLTFSPFAPTAAIPEPGTLALLLVGTLTTGAGVLRRRRA